MSEKKKKTTKKAPAKAKVKRGPGMIADGIESLCMIGGMMGSQFLMSLMENSEMNPILKKSIPAMIGVGGIIGSNFLPQDKAKENKFKYIKAATSGVSKGMFTYGALATTRQLITGDEMPGGVGGTDSSDSKAWVTKVFPNLGFAAQPTALDHNSNGSDFESQFVEDANAIDISQEPFQLPAQTMEFKGEEENPFALNGVAENPFAA